MSIVIISFYTIMIILETFQVITLSCLSFKNGYDLHTKGVNENVKLNFFVLIICIQRKYLKCTKKNF